MEQRESRYTNRSNRPPIVKADVKMEQPVARRETEELRRWVNRNPIGINHPTKTERFSRLHSTAAEISGHSAQ